MSTPRARHIAETRQVMVTELLQIIFKNTAAPADGSRALRFVSPTLGVGFSLERLLIHLASGKNVHDVRRELAASGVMMVPIPRSGIYQGVEGVEEASRTPGVEDIVITAKPGQKLVSLPEGSSYIGFIFARGTFPQGVEKALRDAHQKLHFAISPALAVM